MPQCVCAAKQKYCSCVICMSAHVQKGSAHHVLYSPCPMLSWTSLPCTVTVLYGTVPWPLIYMCPYVTFACSASAVIIQKLINSFFTADIFITFCIVCVVVSVIICDITGFVVLPSNCSHIHPYLLYIFR